MRTRILAGATLFCLTACAVTSPIQPAATSKSAFADAVYKGQTTVIKAETPGNPAYRLFIQGATGFVSMQSVRDDAEQRAKDYCDRQGGRVMESLTETTATPPYILGNFPRIEIVFDCVQKLPTSSAPSDDKYTKLAKLKQLLESGALTQEEFNREKEKVLAEP